MPVRIGDAVGHACHATGCNVPVPPEMFACRRHWFALPKQLRDRIWAAYRVGQCNDWRISHEYAEAARKAVRILAARDSLEPDTAVYDMLDPG